jgi:type IV pilus assembly protein PilN
MILINLLPHREAARKRRKDAFNVSVAITCALAFSVVGLVYLGLTQAQNEQSNVNQILESETATLDNQIKSIDGLEKEIATLRAREESVEGLQAERNLPVRMLSEIDHQLPDGIYISKMVQTEHTVLLNGVAQSNERVSELLRNLNSKSQWFSKPELISIVAGTFALSAREQKKVANFEIRVSLNKVDELEKSNPSATTNNKPTADLKP